MDNARHMKISTVAAVLSVVVTVIGILATFVVPEGRCFLGLDKPDKCQGPVAVPSPLSPGKEGGGTPTSSPATVEPSATTLQPTETETTTSLDRATDAPSSVPSETSVPPIVDELKNPHYYMHDKEYTGRVWINIIPTSANEGKQHTIRIIWGRLSMKIPSELVTLRVLCMRKPSPTVSVWTFMWSPQREWSLE